MFRKASICRPPKGYGLNQSKQTTRPTKEATQAPPNPAREKSKGGGRGGQRLAN